MEQGTSILYASFEDADWFMFEGGAARNAPPIWISH